VIAHQHEWNITELVETIRQRLGEGKRVRRSLPDGGRIHIDRALPFLCVYRRHCDRSDSGTSRLVEGEPSFLIMTDAPAEQSQTRALVQGLAEAMASQFGAFLIVEVWSSPDSHVAAAAESNEIEPTELRPNFSIHFAGQSAPHRTLSALRRGLEKMSYLKQRSRVAVVSEGAAHPPGLPPLLTDHMVQRFSCEQIGISVRPIYRDHETGEVFPQVVRATKRGLSRALKQAYFTFAKTRTTENPTNVFSLGRRAMVKAVWDVDQRLAEIADSFDFLFQVTPVNAEAAWHEFRRQRFDAPPRFYYRPLTVEPAVLKRRLHEVPVEKIEDPTLGDLFRERQDELDRKITLLTDINTSRFLPGSLQIFGGVKAMLLESAMELLQRTPAAARERLRSGALNAHQFAERASEEIVYYQAQMPEFLAKAVVRDDMFSGLLCSGGHLFIGRQTKIPTGRVEALLQHEVGTHLLTYYNGLAEPFRQLHSGFAGYDALQEGLAVLTEFLVGGLSQHRLRVLAARVVATKQVVDGATLIDTFRYLSCDLGFPQRIAYTIAMRTHRGGGLTKDAVYLRGLIEILDYFRGGGDLEPLFVGKIAADHIPLIRELLQRKILRPGRLHPRYLALPETAARLETIRKGVHVLDLLESPKR
jgi:uncharacterized protein (TIGR02421 family)